jgi:hypothetical protein
LNITIRITNFSIKHLTMADENHITFFIITIPFLNNAFPSPKTWCKPSESGCTYSSRFSDKILINIMG